MKVEHFSLSSMGETKLTLGGKYVGIPKKRKSNWITYFLMENPTRTLKDVITMPKFRMQQKHYHYIIVELKNGIKHGLLFHDGECVYDTWSQLEAVEIFDNSVEANKRRFR